MTEAKELKSRGNVFTPFMGCAQIYHQRWYICAPFGEQVSPAMDNADRLAYAEGSAPKAGAHGGATLPHRGKGTPLPPGGLCVQTKAKVRLLSAHKVCPSAPLPCRQHVGIAYG